MENNAYLQDLSNWQWEISGFRKAAFLIEERLAAIHKNVKPGNATRMYVRRLFDRFVLEDLALCELEKNILAEEECILRLNYNNETLQEITNAHVQTGKRILEEERIFPSLKNDYYKLIDDLLFKQNTTLPNPQ